MRADELAIGPVEARAMGALRGLVHDPGTGFASRPPEERLAAMPAILAAIEGIGESHRAEAATPRQRAILDPLLDNHLEHATLQVGRLANQALAEADDGIVENRIGSLQQDAAVNWDDPARLRVLGRAIVIERRAQGERNGWDKGETEAKVRQNASDFYATAIEAAIDRDLDRAGKLLTDARSMLLPERQARLARKLAEAREDRHVAGVSGTLAALPLDPAAPPNPEAYRARAEELTPDDASPELRARIALLADAAQRHATKYWQHDRNQAGLAAVDWIVANPGTPVVAMDRKIAGQLSPEQRVRLQEIETTGRLDTDPDVYDRLDRLAVYDPKTFAATDLSQYRLALDGKDYARFTGFQKGDATFARYDRGRTVLDAGLIKAGLDPADPVAHNARGELDKTLRTFETFEGRLPTMRDIDGIAGDIVERTAGGHGIALSGSASSAAVEAFNEKLYADVTDWTTRPGPDGRRRTGRSPDEVWNRLTEDQQQAVDAILAQNRERNAGGSDVPTDSKTFDRIRRGLQSEDPEERLRWARAPLYQYKPFLSDSDFTALRIAQSQLSPIDGNPREGLGHPIGTLEENAVAAIGGVAGRVGGKLVAPIAREVGRRLDEALGGNAQPTTTVDELIAGSDATKITNKTLHYQKPGGPGEMQKVLDRLPRASPSEVTKTPGGQVESFTTPHGARISARGFSSGNSLPTIQIDQSPNPTLKIRFSP